jgi:hypothetical protein
MILSMEIAIKDGKFILIDWGCGREKEEKKKGS